MQKKTVVIGANGALGSDLIQILPNGVPATHGDLDIVDEEGSRRWLARAEPEVVINTAAFHRVPDCETAYQQAFEVNVIGVRNLARICAELGAHLCHISTDYVFDGTKGKPYREDDPTSPLSIYGISKVAGEQALAAYGSNYSIVRSCGLYGAVPTRAKGGNFVTTMMRLGRERDRVTVVDDETVCPTTTLDLARGIAALLEAGGQGLYNITQSGETTWYGFAKVIFETLSLPAKLEPIASSAFQSVVMRPAYSILDNSKFEGLVGWTMPHWRDALLRHLAQLPQRSG